MKALRSRVVVACTIRGLRGSEGRRRKSTHGRQGKRPARGPAHVVGKIEEFANVANTPCWRFHQIVKGFQASERRRHRLPRDAGP